MNRSRFLPLAASGALGVASAMGCATEPIEFADWTLPVPADARVIGYADAPDEHRSGVIELRADLVLGDDQEDPNEAFYGFPMARAAADGRIFLLDPDNHRVQVFSTSGEYEQTLGGEGQGPEEVFRPLSLAVGPETVVVTDNGNQRYNVWELDGAHRGTSRIPQTGGRLGTPTYFHGLADGTFVGLRATYRPDNTRGRQVSRFSLTSDEADMMVYAEQDLVQLVATDGRTRASVIAPMIGYAVGPHSATYVTVADQYQVLKFGPGSELEWALRVARPPAPYPEERIESSLELVRRRAPDASRSDFAWPASLPALSGLATDAAGRLYVFPYVLLPSDGPPPERRAVDVYSADGERVFAGWIRGLQRIWDDTNGDHVFATVFDRDVEEWVVVRYVLNTPFE